MPAHRAFLATGRAARNTLICWNVASAQLFRGKDASIVAFHRSRGEDEFALVDPRLLPDPVFDTWSSSTGAVGAELPRWPHSIAQVWAKRALDVICAVVLLMSLAPLLLVIAVVVHFSSPGPILFRQQRMGAGGRCFVMYKFRTMVAGNDSTLHQAYYSDLIRGAALPINDVFKLVDDPRITRAGRFLRRFSLDELPQLLNILHGTMSLVGPRPPIPYEVELYGPRDRLRFTVRPGLTGLWQVSGRNRLTFQEMIDLDLTYIERWSMRLDVWIILRTPLVMLAGHDAS
jgi:lipopolysaccharide/colanic/teichoic acid biosynthesis glycosyltransferase